MAIDAMASGVTDPVAWCKAMPAAAITLPVRAAASSANTTRVVGSDVIRTCWSNPRSRACASLRRVRRACRNDTSSSRKAMVSTT